MDSSTTQEDNVPFWVHTLCRPRFSSFLVHRELWFLLSLLNTLYWQLLRGPHLKIPGHGVDFCCQKQQLLKSATNCWVIHKGFAFFSNMENTCSAKVLPTPSLGADRVPSASSIGRTDPYKLQSSVMAWPREIWHHPKSSSFQTSASEVRGKQEGKERAIRNNLLDSDSSPWVDVMLLSTILSKMWKIAWEKSGERNTRGSVLTLLSLRGLLDLLKWRC